MGELFAVDDGYTTRLDPSGAGFVEAAGIIDARTDSLNSRITDIRAQRERLDKRLAGLEKRLLAQFSAMDGLVRELQATSDFLTQDLSITHSTITGNRSN